jgi:hypothetical protein
MAHFRVIRVQRGGCAWPGLLFRSPLIQAIFTRFAMTARFFGWSTTFGSRWRRFLNMIRGTRDRSKNLDLFTSRTSLAADRHRFPAPWTVFCPRPIGHLEGPSKEPTCVDYSQQMVGEHDDLDCLGGIVQVDITVGVGIFVRADGACKKVAPCLTL